jgi:hypothetical protein
VPKRRRERAPTSDTSILIPGDETCFHVFEAGTAEAVAVVGVRASVPIIRVIEAVERPQEEESSSDFATSLPRSCAAF